MKLQARQVASDKVMLYLDNLRRCMKGDKEALRSIDAIERIHRDFKTGNHSQMDVIARLYPDLIKTYQERVICTLINQKTLFRTSKRGSDNDTEPADRSARGGLGRRLSTAS
jgi:hypothetical protein